MMPAERFVSVQIVPEAGVTGRIALPEVVNKRLIPVRHIPSVTIQILVGSHVLLKALVQESFTGVFWVRGCIPPVSGKPLCIVVVGNDVRPRKIHGINGNVGIDIGHIQFPNTADVHGVVVVQKKTLEDLYFLPLVAKEHIVLSRAGQGCHHLRIADVVNHLAQGHLLGEQDGIAILFQKVIHAGKAEFEALAFLELTAAEIDFLIGLQIGILRRILRNAVKNVQLFV